MNLLLFNQNGAGNDNSKSIQNFIYPWIYRPLLGLGRFFSVLIFLTQSVGLLGRGSAHRKAATYTQDNKDTE
jgi:hypothetical protein